MGMPSVAACTRPIGGICGTTGALTGAAVEGGGGLGDEVADAAIIGVAIMVACAHS